MKASMFVAGALVAATFLASAQVEAQAQVDWSIDGGWRLTTWGHDHLPREEDAFRHGFHLGARMMVGRPGKTGFYAAARADGFRAPGVAGFPVVGQVRVGIYGHGTEYDDGYRERTSVSNGRCYYGLGICAATVTTERWRVPPSHTPYVLGFYVGGRYVHDTLGDPDMLEQRERTDAMGASLGLIYQTEVTGGLVSFTELELQRYVTGWEARSPWGFGLRLGVRYGPVYVDLTALFDAAIGRELSFGAGFYFGR